eukprot:TRINITY_DN61359_c0_g1_i1.p1 TRINITY_DN61359_c0_g1~~TRINITY_DN61359_c0_g1_i1.p1  ORF type:complete len:117 (+),score=5.08 TRINITY_DN61359_c0_g1_i1:318-668(+)
MVSGSHTCQMHGRLIINPFYENIEYFQFGVIELHFQILSDDKLILDLSEPMCLEKNLYLISISDLMVILGGAVNTIVIVFSNTFTSLFLLEFASFNYLHIHVLLSFKVSYWLIILS